MHIPDSMLHGAVCPVTAAVGAAGVGAAVWFAVRSPERPAAARFAAVTSMVFAAQMLNFPVAHGTSGHLLGGVLAAALLGIPFGVLSLVLVLAVQAVFFSDGGVNALGANVINMGLIGAGAGGAVLTYFKSRRLPSLTALALASWFSVLLAAVACALELAVSGTAPLPKVLLAMAGVHALIGLGEVAITLAVVFALRTVAERWQGREPAVAWTSMGIAVMAAVLSPFASAFPDGLERVAETLSFALSGAGITLAAFPDYTVFSAGKTGLSTVLAGLAGIAMVSIACILVSVLLRGVSRSR